MKMLFCLGSEPLIAKKGEEYQTEHVKGSQNRPEDAQRPYEILAVGIGAGQNGILGKKSG